jgi:phospholipid transport system substrate-binding protein
MRIQERRSAAAAAVLAVLAVLLVVPPALAKSPGAHLGDQIDRLLQTLAAPELRGPARADERREAVRRFADEIVDFAEIARRALGRHWEERTAAERARFIALFTQLIDRGYFGKLDLEGGERVVVTGERIEGNEAFVRSEVVTADGSRTPVDFVMIAAPGGPWRVCDVRVEGISLVANYRAQFNKILRGSSWDDLLHRLEARATASGS